MFFIGLQIILIILGLYKKRSNVILYLSWVYVIFISLAFTEGADLRVYEILYEAPLVEVDSSDKSLLFDSLVFLLKSYDINFDQFRMICAFMWAIPISLVIKKISSFPAWVMAICTLFPILTFGSQIRNGIGAAFLYWGIYSLCYAPEKIKKWFYTILIVIAGLIHYVFFFYLLGLIALGKRIKDATLVRASLIISVIGIFIVSSGMLYGVAAHYVGDYYADAYFLRNEPDRWKIIPLAIAIIGNTIYSNNAYNFIIRRKEQLSLLYVNYARFVNRLNIILITALPLLLVTNHFFRLYQNIYILSVILVANATFSYTVSGRSFRIVYCCFYMIFVIAVFNFIDGGYSIFWNSISF